MPSDASEETRKTPAELPSVA